MGSNVRRVREFWAFRSAARQERSRKRTVDEVTRKEF
jgi:hypothetical protein